MLRQSQKCGNRFGKFKYFYPSLTILQKNCLYKCLTTFSDFFMYFSFRIFLIWRYFDRIYISIIQISCAYCNHQKTYIFLFWIIIRRKDKILYFLSIEPERSICSHQDYETSKVLKCFSSFNCFDELDIFCCVYLICGVYYHFLVSNKTENAFQTHIFFWIFPNRNIYSRIVHVYKRFWRRQWRHTHYYSFFRYKRKFWEEKQKKLTIRGPNE